MQITEIRLQHQRNDRYSVYVDGEFAVGVSEEQLLELGLYQGQELSDTELDDIKTAAMYDTTRRMALRYVQQRPRSQEEVRRYLQRKQQPAEVIEQVIKRLEKADLLDDEQFAHQWVAWRQATTPRSRARLQAELRQKGIDEDTINAALVAVDSHAELAILKDLIQKKAARYPDKHKLLAYLARQGFAYDDVQRAFNEVEGGHTSD